MSEEEWIRNNVQQRRCEVFCHEAEERKKDKEFLDEDVCKCGRYWSEHPSSRKTSDVWFMYKNTKPVPCKNFGRIELEDGIFSKFVRLDVETPMLVVRKLLLDVWNIPDPNWIISVIGDKGNITAPFLKEKELKTNLMKFTELFSCGQNMWITCEGIKYGVSDVIGELFCDGEKQQWDISLIGINGWSICQKDTRERLKRKESLKGNKDPCRPSGLFSHHLLVNDGSEDENNPIAHKSYQEFRALLESSLAKHNDESSSLPLVVLLYSGWHDVIDGIVAAVEKNMPIVVLEGTGGVADNFAAVYKDSREDPVNTSTSEHGQKWTGTVIDDRLRNLVRKKFGDKDEEKSQNMTVNHKILQCLQKRELITLVTLQDEDEDEEDLTKAIIQALLKTKTTLEIVRMIDHFMPSRMFEGKATAILRQEYNRDFDEEVTTLFLFEAMKLDLSEIVQYIIDYEGVSLPKVTQEKSKQNDDCDNDDDEYKLALQFAVLENHQKCAALFWKKGKNLLVSALEMVSTLKKMMVDKEDNNAVKRKVLEKHSDLFQQRAHGLIDECFNDNKEDTMQLIQRQGEDNMWIERGSVNSTTRNQVLDRCVDECNRKMFGTDALKSYIEQIWYGRINPPKMDASKTPMILSPKDVETKRKKIWRIFLAPVTTYSLNLIFNVVFLVIFGQTLLFELGRSYRPLEGILVFWWLTFVVEEVRQFMKASVPGGGFRLQLKGYLLGNYWNILDCVCLLFFLVGGVLMTIYHVDSTRVDVYQAARMFLSLDIMFFTLRLLQFFAVNNSIGPVLQMIFQMMKDFLPFLAIMLLGIVAQGLAQHALLYPNRDWSPQALLYIPKNSFWNIFGELGLEEIEAQEPVDCSSDPLLYKNGTRAECPSILGQYAVPFLLGIYMLLMNVLLLNIVIARFSYTFARIYKEATWIAAWQSARVTLEYYEKPPLPPPLNVFFHLGKLLACRYRKNKVGIDEGQKQDKDAGETDLASWERSMAENYLASTEFKSGSERIFFSATSVLSTSQAPTVDERLSTLTAGLSELQKENKKMKKMLKKHLKFDRHSPKHVPKVEEIEETHEESTIEA